MLTRPKVVVSVLNWNGLEETRDCIYSLKNVDYSNFEVLIIDNNSDDHEAEHIRREFSDFVTVIRSPTNTGFAGGQNIGIRYTHNVANGDYILMLNNDAVVEPDFLSILVEEMENQEEVAAAGPLILQYGNTDLVWSAGLQELSVSRPFANIYIGENRGEISDEPYLADGVIGCAMMISLNAITEIGLLDSNLFIQHEESDWCKRARTLGYQCLIVPDSVIYHKTSKSLSKVPKAMVYYDVRNRILYFKRHYNLMDSPAFLKGFLHHLYLHYGCKGVDLMTFHALLVGCLDGIRDHPPRYIPN